MMINLALPPIIGDRELPPRIADVHLPVGPGRENNTTDVQLVQLLLASAIAFTKKSQRFGPMRDSRGRAITGIDVDGIFGPVTREAIAAFQRRIELATLGSEGDIVIDGVVHPTGGRAESTRKALFTIVWLNHAHFLTTGRELLPEHVLIEPLRTALLFSTL